MAEHILTRQLTIDLPPSLVFGFFSDAHNLERITPPQLKFKVLAARPIDIKQGTLIDYKLRLRGVPMRWQTEISVWNPPHAFVDRQLKGPYAKWVHRHTFTLLPDGKTLIEDEVKYRLPLGGLGNIAHPIVRRELDYIFDYRQKAVKEILTAEGPGMQYPTGKVVF